MGKYYAVRNGRESGVYTNWESARSQTNGYSGAEFKSFSTPEAAEAYMSGYSNSSHRSAGGSRSSYSGRDSSGYSGGYRGGPAYDKSSSSSSYGGDYSVRYTSGYSRSSSRSSSRSQNIYTDGSSLGNGRKGASAGYGVYWEGKTSNNQCGPVNGAQTNNRGELTAINQALRQIESTGDTGTSYNIKSDSKYSIDAITTWSKGWEQNDWKRPGGQPVQNADLIKDSISRLDNLRSRGHNVGLSYVAGHSGDKGNDAADRLAREGAQGR